MKRHPVFNALIRNLSYWRFRLWQRVLFFIGYYKMPEIVPPVKLPVLKMTVLDNNSVAYKTDSQNEDGTPKWEKVDPANYFRYTPIGDRWFVTEDYDQPWRYGGPTWTPVDAASVPQSVKDAHGRGLK